MTVTFSPLYPLSTPPSPSAPPATPREVENTLYSQFAYETECLTPARAQLPMRYKITHLLNSHAVKPKDNKDFQMKTIKDIAEAVGCVAAGIFILSFTLGGLVVFIVNPALFVYYPLMYLITAVASCIAIGLGAMIVRTCVDYEKEMRLEETATAAKHKGIVRNPSSFAHADAIARARARLNHNRALLNSEFKASKPNGSYLLSIDEIKELYRELKPFDDGKRPFYSALKKAVLLIEASRNSKHLIVFQE